MKFRVPELEVPVEPKPEFYEAVKEYISNRLTQLGLDQIVDQHGYILGLKFKPKDIVEDLEMKRVLNPIPGESRWEEFFKSVLMLNFESIMCLLACLRITFEYYLKFVTTLEFDKSLDVWIISYILGRSQRDGKFDDYLSPFLDYHGYEMNGKEDFERIGEILSEFFNYTLYGKVIHYSGLPKSVEVNVTVRSILSKAPKVSLLAHVINNRNYTDLETFRRLVGKDVSVTRVFRNVLEERVNRKLPEDISEFENFVREVALELKSLEDIVNDIIHIVRNFELSDVMTIDEKIVLNNYELGPEEYDPKWYSYLDDEARREAKRLKRDIVMDIINKHFDDTDDYH